LFSGVIFAGYAIIRKHRLSADDQRRRETIRSASQQRLCLPQSTPKTSPTSTYSPLATHHSLLAIRYSLFAICYLLLATRYKPVYNLKKMLLNIKKNTKQQQANHPATKWLGVCEEHL
jgi:hypothetical protein